MTPSRPFSFRLLPRPARLPVMLSLLSLVLAVLVPAAAGAQNQQEVDELMRRVDKLWRGDSSEARVTMAVKTKNYDRTMTMEMWSQGTEKSLVVIRAPKKDRGIATLKVDKNIWNYLPKIDRVTKIPPSMMMGSWMGSHFTNDDLVRESSFQEDYASRITFSGKRDGIDVWEVTSVARPEAPVVWGKVVMVIEKKRLFPISAVYYDEDGEKARVIDFEEPKNFAGRWVPARMVMKPQDKPGESTTMIYEELKFNIPLADGLFSLRGLKAVR